MPFSLIVFFCIVTLIIPNLLFPQIDSAPLKSRGREVGEKKADAMLEREMKLLEPSLFSLLAEDDEHHDNAIDSD
jgi:hypothetical protein